MRSFTATPRASVLIESMRDIGYSLETALADIIDNSITAGASKIEILTGQEAGYFRIGILDNGSGMTEGELRDAMRPGSRNPLETRERRDLGRFGLGLKTASFSQCRRLSIVTRKDGALSAAVFDLDHVAAQDDWIVQIPDDPLVIPWADRLVAEGTLVVWEKLDRVGAHEDSEKRASEFNRLLDQAIDHLQLVFHRFLEGEPGLRRIKISLNGLPLVPFDPFNIKHPATIPEPATPEVILLRGHEVKIQTYTLPHHSKVSAKEWEQYGGREGYLRSQGFYVYRERRLIIHGTWFGLARQVQGTMLTRVRIDMPNGLDADWKIDVRKSSAQLPPQVRERLRKIVERIGATSKRIYGERGKRLVSPERIPFWERIQDKGKLSYRISAEHPAISDFALQLGDDQLRQFKGILELVSSTLPYDTLISDLSGHPENLAEAIVSDEALAMSLAPVLAHLRNSGLGDDEVRDVLRAAEPFKSNWDRTSLLLLNRGTEHGG